MIKYIIAIFLIAFPAYSQTITPAVPDISNLTCSSLLDAGAFCSGVNSSSLTGTIASARLSGVYSDVTGVGTLASGAVPTTLLTGVLANAQLTGVTLTGAKVSTTAVGSLPTCNGAAQGLSYIVTDALLPVALAVVGAGGAVVVRVLCNGTAWIVG